MRKFIKKSSAMIDYCLLIFVVAITLIMMGRYLQRAMMGKWKEAGDVFGHGRQYSKDE